MELFWIAVAIIVVGAGLAIFKADHDAKKRQKERANSFYNHLNEVKDEVVVTNPIIISQAEPKAVPKTRKTTAKKTSESTKTTARSRASDDDYTSTQSIVNQSLVYSSYDSSPSSSSSSYDYSNSYDSSSSYSSSSCDSSSSSSSSSGGGCD